MSDSLHIRVLAIHDFHGALSAVPHAWSNGRPVGGAAALKAALDSAAAACACASFRLDGGDQMQGTLESNLVHGASAVAALNLMGLDAAAVGNHELDWGVDTLLVRQREAGYAWLAANVFRVDNGERPEWARPYALIERAGVRLAVIGYATTGTPRALRPSVAAPYVFRGGVEPLRDVLTMAGQERPDFTVIVAHAGGDCADGECVGEMVELAAALPRDAVQLIVGGHDHRPGSGVVNGIPIVRAGSNGRALAVVDLIRRRDGSRGFAMGTDTVYADAYTEDAAVLALLEPYRARADSIGRVPVTTLAPPAAPDNIARVGYLMADAARLAVAADFAIYNPGGVRADLAAGVVTYADLYRVEPFGNTVVKLTLPGSTLRGLIEHSLAGRGGYFLSNLRVEFDPAAPPGRRVVSLAFDDGSAVRDEGSYTLAAPDFLADGGDDFGVLTTLQADRSGTMVLDAMIAYLRALPAPVVLPHEPRTTPVR